MLPDEPQMKHPQDKGQQITRFVASAIASISEAKRKRLVFVAVAIVVVLGLFVSAIFRLARPAFLGSWVKTSSMGLPNGTYDNSIDEFTFNADGTGTEEGGSKTGDAGEYPLLTETPASPFTWVAGKDPAFGMNNAPVLAIHINSLPADVTPRVYHWSISDDKETLKMDSDEFTKVAQ